MKKKTKTVKPVKETLYVDGKAERVKPKTINDVLGIKEHKYSTSDRDEYQSSLERMTLWELHRHALEDIGVRPNSERRRMTKTLLGEFDKHQRNIRSNQTEQPKQPKMTKEAQRLMNPY